MEPSELEVLFEDNHLIAINKAAGVGSAHFQGEDETLDRLVKSYLKDKYQKPGNVFLGIVHRLDKPTSGVLLFARTSKAASRLSEQFRAGSVEKVYWAIVEGLVADETGTLEDWLRRDRNEGRVEILPPGSADGQRAVLTYRRLARHGSVSLLELRPETGRTHQLRVQFSHRKLPIYGDTRYGAKQRFGPAIALHARSLTFQHPTRPEPITVTAELPRAWRSRFAPLLALSSLPGER